MKKLEAELKRYANSDVYPFHMPGHKRRGDEIHQIDITEIDGFDNLHAPEDLILNEMKAAAAFYGTQETFFSVNGSTCAILAAICAAVPFGGRLLCERGCHIAVYHAAYLRHLHLLYIEDIIFEENDHYRLKDGAEADAVIITSPSYEGVVKNVRAWSHFANEKNIPLIVDEAHGAHFSMSPYFPRSAIVQGADIVVQSLHKTLPAMTQTSLLHNVTGRVPSAMLRRFLDIYETSSPSYVLMASITSCLHLISDENNDLFERYEGRLRRLREELAKLRHLHLLGGAEAVLTSDEEFFPYRKGTKLDAGKICIFTKKTPLNGTMLYDRLRRDYHLQPEMKAPDYVLLMTSPFDTDEGFERLIEALTEIDASLEAVTKEETFAVKMTIPPCKMTIAEAMDQAAENVALDACEGRVAADYVIVYPPDSPVIVPGEVYSKEVIGQIKDFLKKGLTLTGMENEMVQVLPFCVK